MSKVPAFSTTCDISENFYGTAGFIPDPTRVGIPLAIVPAYFHGATTQNNLQYTHIGWVLAGPRLSCALNFNPTQSSALRIPSQLGISPPNTATILTLTLAVLNTPVTASKYMKLHLAFWMQNRNTYPEV